MKISWKIFKEYIKNYQPKYIECLETPFIHLKECWFVILEFLPRNMINTLSLVNKELKNIMYTLPNGFYKAHLKSNMNIERFLALERFNKFNLRELTIEKEFSSEFIPFLLKYNIFSLRLIHLIQFLDEDLLKLSQFNLETLELISLPFLTNFGLSDIKFQNLKNLSIDYCPGIDFITYSKCENIVKLSLKGQLIENDDLKYFYNTKIQHLDLSRCQKITENAILKLKEHIPFIIYDKKKDSSPILFYNKSYKKMKTSYILEFIES